MAACLLAFWNKRHPPATLVGVFDFHCYASRSAQRHQTWCICAEHEHASVAQQAVQGIHCWHLRVMKVERRVRCARAQCLRYALCGVLSLSSVAAIAGAAMLRATLSSACSTF